MRLKKRLLVAQCHRSGADQRGHQRNVTTDLHVVSTVVIAFDEAGGDGRGRRIALQRSGLRVADGSGN